MPIVEIENGQQIEFPDSMSPKEIRDVLLKKFPSKPHADWTEGPWASPKSNELTAWGDSHTILDDIADKKVANEKQAQDNADNQAKLTERYRKLSDALQEGMMQPDNQAALKAHSALNQAFRDESSKNGVTLIDPDQGGKLPRRDPKYFKDVLGVGDTAAKALAGTYRGASGLVESFGTPEGTMMALGPTPAQKILGAMYLGEMAAHSPAQLETMREALRDKDTEKAFESGTSLAVLGLAGKEAIKHAVETPQARASREAANILKGRASVDDVETPLSLPSKAAKVLVRPAAADILAEQQQGTGPTLTTEPGNITIPNISMVDEVRQKNAKTINAIQALYPNVQKPYEYWLRLRQAAWETPKQPIVQPEKGQNATQEKPQQVSLPPERPGDDSGGTPTETGVGGGVQRPETLATPPTKTEDVTPTVSKSETVEPPVVSTPTVAESVEGQQSRLAAEQKTREEQAANPNNATSIQNAVTERERASRGLPPAIEPLRRKFGDVWDSAMARIDQDPAWQDKLIDELREEPRALTDQEDAALLQRQITLHNIYAKATRDLAQLYKDKTTDLIPQYQAHLASISDQLLDLYQINKRAGTETGRGLAARKMMADEDFKLINMEVESRAAKGGRPLTASETENLKKLHDEIKGWQEQYDKHVADSAEKLANIEAQLAIERITKTPEAIPPHVKVIADRIKAHFDARAAAAMNRLKGKVFTIGPEVLIDLVDLGASKILAGVADKVAWGSEMIRDLGESIKPHLETVWKAAQQAIDDKYAKTALDRAQEQQARIKSMPAPQKVEYYKTKVAEKLKADKKAEVTTLVQKLARALVELNPKIERDALIDSVHSTLRDIDPAITRSVARDMISGYGDFKPLTKDEVSKRLRDLKGQMQQVAKLEDMQNKQPPLKTGIERREPSLEERRLIKLVNEAKREFQVPITDPSTQLKSSLDTLKSRMETRAREYQEKLAAGDFAPSVRREIKLDSEALRLKGELERSRQKFYDGLVADRLKNRSQFEKVADTMVKWSRGFLLSGPSTLAKLTAAAFWRMVQNPLEELVGAGLGNIPGIRQISERAPIEGGVNVRAEAKAVTEGFMQGLKDAVSTAKTGKSVLDRVFGGPRDVGIGEETEAQKSVLDFFGHLHGALKAPVKRAAFARAYEKLTAFNMKHGVDVTDPLVQTRMAVQAYKRANMDIFMQPNRYATALRMAIRGIEAKDKVSGKPSVSGKLAATATRVLIPIVKVPTNIVGEALQYATGLWTGSVRAAKALRSGIDNIKPEQADLIMRELKKGSIGTAILLVGYFNPTVFGGFFQQGKKRPKSEVPYGGMKVDGKEVPKQLLHTPALEVAQMGATVRRVADAKLTAKDAETQGTWNGAIAGALGLIDDVPFINDMFELSKVMHPQERGQFFAELAKSRLVPQMLSQVAEHYDRDAYGNPIKRQAKTALQGIESGIPGLREKLPIKDLTSKASPGFQKLKL